MVRLLAVVLLFPVVCFVKFLGSFFTGAGQSLEMIFARLINPDARK